MDWLKIIDCTQWELMCCDSLLSILLLISIDIIYGHILWTYLIDILCWLRQEIQITNQIWLITNAHHRSIATM